MSGICRWSEPGSLRLMDSRLKLPASMRGCQPLGTLWWGLLEHFKYESIKTLNKYERPYITPSFHRYVAIATVAVAVADTRLMRPISSLD